MKINFLLPFLFMLFAGSLSAQNFNYSQRPLDNHFYYSYFGTAQGYHYFKTESRQYTRVKVNDLKVQEKINFKLYSDNEVVLDMVHLNDKILMLSSSASIDKDEENSNYRFYMYYFEPSSGKEIKSKRHEFKNKRSRIYEFRLDTLVKRIFLLWADSVVACYDYDFEKKEDGTPSFIHSKPEEFYLFMHFNRYLYKSIGSSKQFTLRIDEKLPRHIDSTSMYNYTISYTNSETKDLFYFKYTKDEIRIKSKSKKDHFTYLKFGGDTLVVEINFREDKNGHLVLFGKFVLPGSGSSEYGFFVTEYDLDLKEVKKRQYFDFGKIDNTIESGFKTAYAGFVFSDLYDSKYEFYFDQEDVFVLTYQNIDYDKPISVFVLKIDTERKASFQIIRNLPMKSTLFMDWYNLHMAIRTGNTIQIVFYDNASNMGKTPNDPKFKEGKTNVLASVSYNWLENSVGVKKQIASKKELTSTLDFYTLAVYNDTVTNRIVCFVAGKNKRWYYESLHTFEWTY